MGSLETALGVPGQRWAAGGRKWAWAQGWGSQLCGQAHSCHLSQGCAGAGRKQSKVWPTCPLMPAGSSEGATDIPGGGIPAILRPGRKSEAKGCWSLLLGPSPSMPGQPDNIASLRPSAFPPPLPGIHHQGLVQRHREPRPRGSCNEIRQPILHPACPGYVHTHTHRHTEAHAYTH